MCSERRCADRALMYPFITMPTSYICINSMNRILSRSNAWSQHFELEGMNRIEDTSWRDTYGEQHIQPMGKLDG